MSDRRRHWWTAGCRPWDDQHLASPASARIPRVGVRRQAVRAVDPRRYNGTMAVVTSRQPG
ncbi:MULTISPECIES: hypothetical protein [Prauserella salsuginis group]|uniref:Uncharacterized protein n=1 Tax=Prauserella salsuginis TaxID=387889 RepID=A0ABW6G068_9PSEU|nr:hypothetical protein [Prauserella flava]